VTELLREPYTPGVLAQLERLKVDHAVAVIVDGPRVVGYTMCHNAGPKSAPLRCSCEFGLKQQGDGA